ncbi:MAG: hypothetical protein IV100_06890 [Myxococcales bacterium]|nr:hypothetical protein [Myxococcales bacterium]
MTRRSSTGAPCWILLLTVSCATNDAATGPVDVTPTDDLASSDTVVADVPEDTWGGDDAPPIAPEDADAPTDVSVEEDGEGITPTDDTATPAPDLAGPCAPDRRIGGFTVEAQDEYSLVDGKVLAGVVPVSIPEPVLLDLGPSCALTKRRILYCDPGCGPSETCGLDETCIAYPSSQDVGTVTITGLAGGTVTLTPKKPGNNYFDTDVPHPVFAAGSTITMSAAGGAAAFELHAIGVRDLPIAPIQWNLAAGEPLSVTWEAPPTEAVVPGAVIEVRMSVDQHGSSPATLTCVLDDTGSAEIPAVAVDALLAAGISGFPNGRLRRMTADHTDAVGGCVELVVTSTREALVRVEGVTPCKSKADCPSGQTCDTVIELCK